MHYFKYIFLSFLLTFSTTLSLAQTRKSANLFLDGGLAFPSRPKSFSNDWERGYNYGAGIGIPLSESISLTAAINYNTFSLNKDNLLKSAGFNSIGVSVTGGDVSMMSITGNFKLLLSTAPNTAALYIIAGLGYCKLTQSDATISYQGQSLPITGSSKTAFLILPGAGIQIPIGANALFIEGRYGFATINNVNTAYIPVKLGIQISI